MFLDLPCYFILWSYILVILWLYYTTVTRPGHHMFIICMSHHTCTILLYMMYRLDFPIIVITFSSRYCQNIVLKSFLLLLFLHILFYYSFLFVYSCWCASDGHYYFSVSRSESWYRDLIVEHMLVQSYSSVSSFSFLDVSYSVMVDDIVYDFVFHICTFILAFGCESAPKGANRCTS